MPLIGEGLNYNGSPAGTGCGALLRMDTDIQQSRVRVYVPDKTESNINLTTSQQIASSVATSIIICYKGNSLERCSVDRWEREPAKGAAWEELQSIAPYDDSLQYSIDRISPLRKRSPTIYSNR